jgi:O-antigen biosynthesis rhamnosyltransferase
MAKILLVAEAYAPRHGGGVRYEIDLVNFLRERGHCVDVVTVNDEEQTVCEASPSGTVIRLARHLEFDSARLSTALLPFFLRRIPEYDLVHFNAPNPLGEVSYFLSRMFGRAARRTVCSYHGEVVSAKSFHRLYNSWLLPTHMRACQRIIASSPNIVTSTHLLRRYHEKVVLIPYGIDTERFQPSIDWQAALPIHPLRFLFVGRLVRYKGIGELLEAFTEVKGSLDIVGDGPLRTELISLAAHLGLSDRVSFRGTATDDELIAYYRRTDVFVLPSVDRGESFGYVLAEAMACGVCAISTELGTGTSFINQHSVTGLVVPPRNRAALIEAMQRLDNNREELAQFRANARPRVQENFSKARMLERTSELYRELGVAV